MTANPGSSPAEQAPIHLQPAARLLAALIAATAWTALAIQGVATDALTSSTLQTLWVLLAYFTITTNLLVAMVFSALALRRSPLRSPSLIAGTMLSIVLVGVTYGLLLHGLIELSGGSAIANVLLHMVTPVAVPLFWLLLVPHGRLAWRDPLVWALYPLAYLAYALLRGAATHRYPYPFLNVPTLGWPQTLLNITSLSAAFLLTAFAVVWLDRTLGRRSAAEPAQDT